MKDIITPIVMIIFILTSCTDDNDPIMSGEIIGISVSVPGISVEPGSRTSITGTTSNPSGVTTSFISGDNIGVSETLTGKYNVNFTYNGTSWSTSTPLYWRNGTSTHTFYAYYPYNASTQQLSTAIPILNNQTVSTLPDATCDMLVTATAKTQARSSGTSVSLTMKHALAILRFDVKMSILSLLNPYNLDTIIVRGGNTAGGSNPYGMFNIVNNVSSVSYNLSNNTFLINPNNNTTCTQQLKKIPPRTNILSTAVSFYVFVIPGTYSSPVPAVNLSLSTLGILTKKTGFKTLPNYTSFAAGSMYIYQISVGLDLRSSSETDIKYMGKHALLPAEIKSYVP